MPAPHADCMAAAEDRVDEDLFKFRGRGVAFFIGHEQAVGQIDLVGGEADALVLVHQVDHFFDEFSQVGVDAFQRPRAVAERGVRVVNDLKTQSCSKMSKGAGNATPAAIA